MVAIGQMQHIIKETILLIPHFNAVRSDACYRACYVNEMLPEFAGDIFISMVMLCQFQRDRKKIERVHCHPACAVRLFDVSADRQWFTAIEDTDVIESEKASFKHVVSFSIFTVHPPGKV